MPLKIKRVSDATAKKYKMRVCHISDTHGGFPKLSGRYDLVIHSGDFFPNSIAVTIGNESSYDKALSDNPVVHKLGKTEDYPGGIVWQTPIEAREFIDSDRFLEINWGDNRPRYPHQFRVYVIDLPNGWDCDTYPSVDYAGANNLLVDAVILRKFEEQ
jgi:3',5'-cyclic AMP phosphodiesterase CpdA